MADRKYVRARTKMTISYNLKLSGYILEQTSSEK